MSIFTDLILVAAVTIYIVDVSGFTDSWRSLLSRWLHITSLRPLPPFDCGKCATWWVCLIYGSVNYGFSVTVIALSALLSLLSIPIGHGLIFIREGMTWIIDKLMPR